MRWVQNKSVSLLETAGDHTVYTVPAGYRLIIKMLGPLPTISHGIKHLLLGDTVIPTDRLHEKLTHVLAPGQAIVAVCEDGPHYRLLQIVGYLEKDIHPLEET